MRVTWVTLVAKFEVESSSEEDYEDQVDNLILELEGRGWEVDIEDEEVVEDYDGGEGD